MKRNRLEEISSLFAEEVYEHLTEHQDFAKTEHAMMQKMNQVVCQSIETAFRRFDDTLALTRPDHLKIKGKVSRSILTLSGPVRLRRRRYTDTYSGKTLNLADVVLDIEPSDKITARVASVVTRFALDASYQTAADVLEIYSGHRISRPCVKSILERSSTILKAQRDKKDFSGTRKVDKLCCEADGTHVALQQRHIPKSKRKKKSKEVHVAVIYEGKRQNKNNTKSRINTHFLATQGHSDELWDVTERYIDATYDTTHVKRAYLGVDGASWCAKGADVLPGTVKVGYDLWHVHRIIKGAATREIASEIIAVLNRKGIASCIECIKNYSGFFDATDTEHRLDELISFFAKYEDMIRCGLRYNLGTIEGTNAHLIGSRLKNFGGGWSPAGIEAMVTLRAARASGEDIPLIRPSVTINDEPLDEGQPTSPKSDTTYRSLYNNTVEYYHQAKIAWENESCKIKHNMAQVY